MRSALETGRLLAARELDAEAECEAALARAASAGAAFTRLTAERARDEARSAAKRLRAGAPAGPLDGVPVAWKDIVDVAGTPTTAASAVLAGAPAAVHDAPAVARLAAAGLVCVGKTNLSEFAFSGLGINAHHGTPRNPLDPARVPGGSSSGSAVAVAAGVVPCAIGTDTSGSIRVPAASAASPASSRRRRGSTAAASSPVARARQRGPARGRGRRPRGARRGAAGRAAGAGDGAAGGVAGLRFVVAEGDPVEPADPGVAAAVAAAADALAAAGASSSGGRWRRSPRRWRCCGPTACSWRTRRGACTRR